MADPQSESQRKVEIYSVSERKQFVYFVNLYLVQVVIKVRSLDYSKAHFWIVTSKRGTAYGTFLFVVRLKGDTC